MTRPRILQPGQSYKFSQYFELPYAPADILAELGCSYERTSLQLRLFRVFAALLTAQYHARQSYQ